MSWTLDKKTDWSKLKCSCFIFPLTGLTDDMRADFHVMKDIAVHTRVPPDKRTATLQGFINQINR